MTSPIVLSLQNVSIHYGATVAVDALSLDVRRGEVLGLLGPNGCGKSSTLGAVAGGVTPCAGAIAVEGITARAQPLEYRRRIGLVPQELAIYEELTAAENLQFIGRLYGLRGETLRQRVADVLDLVQLTDHARQAARTYSGGMQRRLNLACALLHEPSLLLLDEPTVGLDIAAREAIFRSLRALRDRGHALVFTTHHLEEAEQLCDRVAILDRGRLQAHGTLAELLTTLPALAVAPAPWGAGAGRARRAGHGAAPPPARAMGGVAATWSYQTPSLTRVFLELTGRSVRES